VNELFVDTFYWLAAANVNDPYHEEAIARTETGRIVTTDAVRVEVMDALCQRRFRPLAVRFWIETSTDRDLTIVSFDQALLDRAAALYTRRMDKDWSLTDCLSIVVMTDRGIRTALTGDHHFEQAGFEIAFKS
jgi:predicted nucleic acid-binding protein